MLFRSGKQVNCKSTHKYPCENKLYLWVLGKVEGWPVEGWVHVVGGGLVFHRGPSSLLWEPERDWRERAVHVDILDTH